MDWVSDGKLIHLEANILLNENLEPIRPQINDGGVDKIVRTQTNFKWTVEDGKLVQYKEIVEHVILCWIWRHGKQIWEAM